MSSDDIISFKPSLADVIEEMNWYNVWKDDLIAQAHRKLICMSCQEKIEPPRRLYDGICWECAR